MIKVYRAVADITPDKMEEFYAASSEKQYLSHGEHTVGKGMYFALNQDTCLQYGKIRKPHKYFILGSFKILGNYKVYDNVAPENVDPEMARLERLIKEIQKKQNENFEKQYGKYTLHDDDFLILSHEEIDKILTEQSHQAQSQKKLLGLKDEDLEIESNQLGQLYWQAVKLLNDQRLNYDLSIFNYEEVCIHNPEVIFNLSSFAIYFNQETDALELFKEIKTGELEGSSIKDIDSAYIPQVTKFLLRLN